MGKSPKTHQSDLRPGAPTQSVGEAQRWHPNTFLLNLSVCLKCWDFVRIPWFDTKNYVNIKRNASKNYQQNDMFK